MTKPTLYVQPFTIFDRRVLAYIQVKGIRDELEIVHVGPEQDSPGRRPGQTPLQQVSKGEKEDISDSSAIIEYLEDMYDD
jgi:glutathione S-transferase